MPHGCQQNYTPTAGQFVYKLHETSEIWLPMGPLEEMPYQLCEWHLEGAFWGVLCVIANCVSQSVSKKPPFIHWLFGRTPSFPKRGYSRVGPISNCCLFLRAPSRVQSSMELWKTVSQVAPLPNCRSKSFLRFSTIIVISVISDTNQLSSSLVTNLRCSWKKAFHAEHD